MTRGASGFALRMGYDFNEHLRQVWSYSLVGRTVFNVAVDGQLCSSQDQAGYTLLSQVGQVLALDYRDSKIEPHSGSITSLGTDFAGLGTLRQRHPVVYFCGRRQGRCKRHRGLYRTHPVGWEREYLYHWASWVWFSHGQSR